MNIGIDIGNGYVKYPEGKFSSKIKIGELINFGKQKKEVNAVEFCGTKYIVGDGSIFTGDDRYFTTEYTICLLTALALSSKNEDFIEANVVIGLPEKKHKLVSKKLKEHICNLGQQQIVVNGSKYTIRINDCIIFIEGAYPILTEEEENILVVDNGAGTINVSQWEELSIINSATYTESMYKMYAEIASYLNTNKGADFKPSEIEKILNKKKTVINNIETDITDIRPIIANHIKEISSYIRNDFKTKNASRIYLIGGGGADTLTYWQAEFPVIELVPESQFINSKVYNIVAEEEFGEDNGKN